MGAKCSSAQTGPVQAAWDNHFAAFGGQDIEKILVDYSEQSVITVYDQTLGAKTVYSGVAGARTCFEGLFKSLHDCSDLAAPVQVVKEATKKGDPGSVFLIWSCPASGYRQATDTFIFDKSHKIFRQNVVVAYQDPKGDGSVVAKNDSEAPTSSGAVHTGWANHFAAFGGQDVEKILLDYVAESEISVFNHADGSHQTYKGLDGARDCFTGLFKSLFDLKDLSAPIIHVEESEGGAAGQVFLVWSCPASGYARATDTFIFNSAGKITQQHVVVHYESPASPVKAAEASGRGTIYCCCGGTRGDQQPMALIARQLKSLGYNIVLAVGSEGKSWCDDFGFDFHQLESFEDLVRNHEAYLKAAETGDVVAFFAALGDVSAQVLPKDLSGLVTKIKSDPQAVGFLATSTHSILCEIIQRKFNIFSMNVMMSPFCPTKTVAPYIIDIRNPATWQGLPNPDGSVPGPLAACDVYPGEAVNYGLWQAMLSQITASVMPGAALAVPLCDAADVYPSDPQDVAKLLLNAATAQGFDPEQPMTTAKSDTVFGYSEYIMGGWGAPEDYTQRQRDAQLGFIFPPEVEGSEMSSFDPSLQDFIAKGAPVYFGWGSMARTNNDQLLRAAITACRIAGKRGVILRGWAHLDLSMLDPEKDSEDLAFARENIMIVHRVHHNKLFPQCECIVTHGGAGTAASMLLSGVPGIVTPVWWDQTFFGDRLEAMGMGKRGPQFSQVTGEDLAGLIKELTTDPSFREKAQLVSKEFKLEKASKGDVAIAQRFDTGCRLLSGR